MALEDATTSPTNSPVKLKDVQLALEAVTEGYALRGVHLYHNLPKFSAAALPAHVLYTLARRGRTGITVEGMVMSTFLFGLFPGYLSYVTEGVIRSSDQPDFGELVHAYHRLKVDPEGESLVLHSLVGYAVGFILAVFKRPTPPTGPVRGGIIGWADEKMTRLMDISMTTAGIGGALGALAYYGKRAVRAVDSYASLSWEDTRERLRQNMHLLDEQIAWLRQYAPIQFWCGIKAATTLSLLSVHEVFWLTAPDLRPHFPKMFARAAVGCAAYGLLIGAPAVHGVLVDKSLDSMIKSHQMFYEGRAARAWNQHIACGALLAGCSGAAFIKRAPTDPILKDFVRAGRFVYTPRNVVTVGGASMLFGGGLGSAVFLVRSAFTSWP